MKTYGSYTMVDVHGQGRPLRRGDTLDYTGDASPSLYRLEKGLLRAVRLTPQGRNLTSVPRRGARIRVTRRRA